MGDPAEPLTILVVDDDETVLESLRAQLRRGLDGAVLVDTASSGEEALELGAEYLEDGVLVPVILCDEIMPGMRGHAVLRELHRMLPEARTVLLTGQADLSSVTAAVNEASLYQYISKPWEQVDLLLTVRGAIDAWQQDRDRERRLRIFHSFVPEAFLAMLGLDDPTETALGISKARELTVLFVDIRNFTALSERLGSAGTFRFLNACFEVLVPIIVEHGGVVDKYIGDALLALFDDPDSAICAAEALVAAAPGIQTGFEQDAPQVRLGIGLNTGDLILGTVGVPERLQTTVIGDVVNTAARIEALTKDLRTSVLLSTTTAGRTTHPTRYVGRFELRGKGALVPLFQLLSSINQAERSAIDKGAAEFNGIVQALPDRSADRTVRALDGYLRRYPADQLAQALFHRLQADPPRPG